MSKYIITSFYTRNTGYEQEVAKLRGSLQTLGLPFEIVSIENTGSWDLNTKYKPVLIRNMLNKYPDRSIVYLDADAVVYVNPILFEQFTCDMAFYVLRQRNREELLSGTLYVANNQRCYALLDEWIKRCKVDRRWEQKILQDIITTKFVPNLVTQELLPEYCKIFDTMREIKAPVIEHFQASRKLKPSVNKRTISCPK